VRGPIAKARPGAALLALFLAALALGACGDSSGGDSSSAGTQAPAGSKTAETGSESGPAGATSESSGSASAPRSSRSSSSATSAGPGSSGVANPAQGAGAPSAPAAKARRKAHAARHRLEAQAGAAAPFLVAQGDNSIPTYGSEASASQQAEATAALSGYLAARAGGEWSTACTGMAATVRKQLELLAGEAGSAKPSCADAYAKLSERVPASQRVSPLSGGLAALRVEGDKAFALFYGPREQQYMMPMVSEGGAWKVNQIEAVPWPVGAPAQGSP
jgi:hypothetical protein